MDYHHLLVNLGFMFLSDDSGEDDEVLAIFIFELRDPALTSVFKLKDRGNCIFREGNHLLAFSYYKQAIKFLYLLDLPSTSEQQSCATSLTISLILNLAACEMKLSHFAEAWFHCNLVLNCDQCNVKARYRRGLASKNLNLFSEALEDFEAALKLDPKNKDISRELHSMVDRIAQNLCCKQVGYQFDPLASDRKGKKPLLNNDVVDKSVLCETGEASCSFVLPVIDASSDHGIAVSNSDVVMDVLSTDDDCSSLSVQCFANPSSTLTPSLNRLDVSNEVSSDTAMNVTSTPCSNQNQNHNQEALFLKFNKKGGDHSHLRIDANSYNELLQGKEIHVHQHKFLTTMKIRVHSLPQKKNLTGTPHEEISREAAVPPYNPMFEMHNEISSFESSENVELVEEEVILQIDKKKRLSLDSSMVSKISMEQFHFAALRKHSSKICHSKRDRFKGRDQMARSAGKLKTKSLVSVEHLNVVCRCTLMNSTDKKTKRKDVNLILFDNHYHPPFKKRRLCPSSPSFSQISQDCWSSSGFGVSTL